MHFAVNWEAVIYDNSSAGGKKRFESVTVYNWFDMHLGSSSTSQNSKGHVTDRVVVFVWEKIEVRQSVLESSKTCVSLFFFISKCNVGYYLSQLLLITCNLNDCKEKRKNETF